MTTAPEILDRYFRIVQEYSNCSDEITGMEQKNFYIMYMTEKRPDLSIKKHIDLLEKLVKDFETTKETSDARKMIQAGFKEYLDKKMESEIEL